MIRSPVGFAGRAVADEVDRMTQPATSTLDATRATISVEYGGCACRLAFAELKAASYRGLVPHCYKLLRICY